MKVGLYLMTSKGEQVLDAALRDGVEIVQVTTAPATGMNDQADQRIAARCKELGIPVFLRAAPPGFEAEWSIAAGWRKLLKLPNLVVIHDSILPAYRGFSPLITALVTGAPFVGATAFLAIDEPDAGPIIAQQAIALSYPTTIKEVIERLHPVYHSLASEVLCQLVETKGVRYVEQDHSRATYSLPRDEEDYRIDWGKDALSIARLVGAVGDPFPGAQTTVAGSSEAVYAPMTVHAVELEPDVRIEDRQPGKVAFIRNGCPIVVCGMGLLRITEMTHGWFRAGTLGHPGIPWEQLRVRFR